MDSHILASSLGAGFAIGLATMLVATFTAIPASYVMNKFIYGLFTAAALLVARKLKRARALTSAP